MSKNSGFKTSEFHLIALVLLGVFALAFFGGDTADKEKMVTTVTSAVVAIVYAVNRSKLKEKSGEQDFVLSKIPALLDSGNDRAGVVAADETSGELGNEGKDSGEEK